MRGYTILTRAKLRPPVHVMLSKLPYFPVNCGAENSDI